MTFDPVKQSHYDTLGLSPDASQDAIRTAYKQLALQWHPDRNRDDKEHAQRKFVEIKEAYLALLEKPRSNTADKLKAKTKAKAKAAPAPPASTTTPSSTPSECGSDRTAAPPPDSPPKKRTKLNRREKPKGYRSAQPPAAFTPSSSSQSEPDHTLLQQHLPYLKIERDASDSSFRGSKQKDENEEFEFVSPTDLDAPLLPLRIPAENLSKDWIFPLPLDLEDLYHGITQHYRITRTVNSGETQVVKIDISVSPSWRTGTRLRIPSAGNQRADGSFQDIVFVVKEVPHPRFTRIGNDLVLSVHVPWASTSSPYADVHSPDHTGPRPSGDQGVYVRAMNGEQFTLPIPRSLVQSAEGTRIVGAGMPIQRNGKSKGKGDLLVRWVFAFPDLGKAHKLSPWMTFRKAMVWRT